ncbi:hypothetical protein [Corynebacterium sp. CCM 9204]|uniref:hypothetical protein n=1 Tax=Corynebacterium sp. CCM 9204 TaxID=3057616 RepID=UPI00352682AF
MPLRRVNLRADAMLPVADEPLVLADTWQTAPAVWLVDAHGDAGVTSLSHVWEPMGDAGQTWPGTDEHPWCVVVRRSTKTGLEKAHQAVFRRAPWSRAAQEECRQCYESGQMDDAQIQDVDDRVAMGLVGTLSVMESWDAVAGGLDDTLDLQVSKMGEAGREVEKYRDGTALTSAEVVEDLSQTEAAVDAVAAAVEVGDFVRDPSADLAKQSVAGGSRWRALERPWRPASALMRPGVLDQPQSLEL